MTYSVSVRRVEPRPFAAVRASLPARDVPRRFREFLDQVYAAARNGAVVLDGQNIFVYRPHGSDVEVQFGVGVKASFTTVGHVEPSEVPGGEVAVATHWGDYSGIGAAHEAVIEWCRGNGRERAGVSWEVYGHWSDDPAKVLTDVFHLLR